MTRLRKGLALLLGLGLVFNWGMARVLLTWPPNDVNLIAFSYLAISIGAITGLGKGRHWGFVLFYLLIPISTFFLSISIVPGIPRLFPAQQRPFILTLLNALSLALAIIAHLGMVREKAARPLHRAQ